MENTPLHRKSVMVCFCGFYVINVIMSVNCQGKKDFMENKMGFSTNIVDKFVKICYYKRW